MKSQQHDCLNKTYPGKDCTSKQVNMEWESPWELQPWSKNYRQPRNSESGSKQFFQKSFLQLAVQDHVVKYVIHTFNYTSKAADTFTYNPLLPSEKLHAVSKVYFKVWRDMDDQQFVVLVTSISYH